LTFLLTLAVTLPVMAQEETPELEIGMSRDFGYGGFGGDIQGTFTIRVSGPDDLVKVEFYLDGALMGTDSESPFRLQFNTESYDLGVHRIHAMGTLADGSEIQSRELTREFVSGSDVFANIGPILGVVALVMVVGALVPVLTGRKSNQRPIGEYSAAGGTVCPRCRFPYSRNMFSPNVVFGKLERCPHCGKWSIRPRASHADLQAAEERLRASQQESAEIQVDPEESLKRALDDSRFDD
jgi:hypothetical protein